MPGRNEEGDCSQMEIGAFINKWRGVTGGAERANYAQFINDLCSALDLPVPGVATGGVLGTYQFEGPVPGGGAGGNTGAIDLYKRGCFILEAKQSKLREADRQQAQLFDVADTAPASPSGARYDRFMRDALSQAKRYAANLPGDHPSPKFLIVCDVGRAFELYFDWSGNGRGYGHFPDQHSYRFELHRFAEEGVRDMFRAVWTDPASIDPRARSAEVSRSIAGRLAEVSKWLENIQRVRTAQATDGERSLAIEETALFLMRIIFCMFAEDVGLLPKDSFSGFLKKAVENEAAFEPELHDLWSVMGRGDGKRYASAIGGEVRYFNGGLFASAKTYGLSNADRGELLEAAKADWTKVEPAIFGTLLEQALTPSERAKLGAHYTPRPYVERLVQATIMDVLDAEWEAILNPPRNGEGDRLEAVEGHATQSAPSQGQDMPPVPLHHPADGPPPRSGEDLLAQAAAFHARLASLRILDPACGTGNFLYVAMENLMRLEGDVIETIRQLGGEASPQVGPQQFLGLELNPRAAVIAELVLWIGWLRWRMKNDPDAAPDPVLKQFGNINFGGHAGYDAVLRRKPTGEADTENPMLPDWPEADFIVGNPPFIGGKDIRRNLGGDYAEALWKANSRVPKSADFVMQWWDRAAHVLTAEASPLIRFGFVTTNSITQTFSRRVIEGYLKSSPERGGGPASLVEGHAPQSAPSRRQEMPPVPLHPPLRGRSPSPTGEDRSLSLILAIPDHPWTKATKDAAAVRIAMTVAARGQSDGQLVEIVSESGLDSDNPVLAERESSGRINPDLSLGSDAGSVVALRANEGISSRGVALHGAGFIVSPHEAANLGLGKREGLERHIRDYRHGRDLLGRSRGVMAIDLFGLTEKDVRTRFPEVYQHVLRTVKPERDTNRRPTRRDNWWLFGELAPAFRDYAEGLSKYIATVETSKHRIFQFLDAAILPDNMLVAIGSDDAFHLGVLSSSIHCEWTLQTGGWLGMGNDNRYNKSKCFDPFPFPDAAPAQRAAIAELAEELDQTRKEALAEVPGLTMTEIYNLRTRQRAGQLKDLLEAERADQARARIVDRLHEQIDAEVAAAYGWADDWKNGNLPPAEIVARLVALNAARAAEEKAGTIRWLRPDYQRPRFEGQG